MRLTQLLATAAALQVASAGFATYKEIGADRDNSGEIAYSPLTRSDTLFLYIQIIAGSDHSKIIDDFKTLARNYGEQGIRAIPRVRYGSPSGEIVSEPEDADLILEDVRTWVKVFQDVEDTIVIPVIQAGFLGMWGEWHSGYFCPGKGEWETSENQDVKRAVVEALLEAGPKIAMRYPQDHEILGFEGNRHVTIHNDCIFNNGPGGDDGGTFPEEDIETWSDYLKKVASNNTYGGEPCNQAEGSGYDWSDFDDVCGANGLEAYIHEFQVSYLNPENPPELKELFEDSSWSKCIDRFEAALNLYH
ncbi:uncharacterized protein J7T54_006362 [Emericellopsis cladophorae]|uniref:DUF4874 domain-containing protein n=1 Tax=Emericellopsis cladophorae TaxID=2686198 RepID=A0A9P9YAG0_9HYPO|nr:uncharacterized protein J7T54_006362 [Emericellopsis cladophorae]KAI6786023.1 hypothetical protein J7T54_006362 [Emericellopsis cladophorae]